MSTPQCGLGAVWIQGLTQRLFSWHIQYQSLSGLELPTEGSNWQPFGLQGETIQSVLNLVLIGIYLFLILMLYNSLNSKIT